MYLYSDRVSEGMNELSQETSFKRIKREGSSFKGSQNKVVINWGNSTIRNSEILKCQILNEPGAVAKASNKLTFFEEMTKYVDIILNENLNVFCPEFPFFFVSRKEAEKAINDGHTICCRTVLKGHSGEGLVIAKTLEELVDAPLYTQYIPKKQEYRVHVAFDEAILITRKARRRDVPDDKVNWQVRNFDNGFTYVLQEKTEHLQRAVDLALSVINILKLDFGAVDIIYNHRYDGFYVLEVNTAPGLEGRTVKAYAEAFKKYKDEM